MDITEVIRIITGGPPLTPPMPKIPEKRKPKTEKKKPKERSHELRWKDTFPYHLVLGSPFESVCPSGFCCVPFAAWATVLSLTGAVL